MSDYIDVDAIFAYHSSLHRCVGGDYVTSRTAGRMDPPCEVYLMAKHLIESRQKLMRLHRDQEEASHFKEHSRTERACHKAAAEAYLNAADVIDPREPIELDGFDRGQHDRGSSLRLMPDPYRPTENKVTR